MSLKDEENVTLLDPFTHTQQDSDEIRNFDFWVETQKKEEREKVKIDETFCTLVTVGGQFLKKKIFQKVLRKIYKMRRRFREYLIKIYLYVCQKEAHTYIYITFKKDTYWKFPSDRMNRIPMAVFLMEGDEGILIDKVNLDLDYS